MTNPNTNKRRRSILDAELDDIVRQNANRKNPRKKPRTDKTDKTDKPATPPPPPTSTAKDDKRPSIIFIMGGGGNSDSSDSDSDSADPTPALPAPYVCPGAFCDHDPNSEAVPVIPDRLVNPVPNHKIVLQDLIDLGNCFHCQKQKLFHNNSLERLAKLSRPLTKLATMIGMKIIKENFAEQIVYFLTELDPNPTELLHTILEGPPGVGKTHIIDILADIYLNMGFLTKNIIKKVKLSDLKGKYVGHTAPLTQNAINEAMGGVLVIDEVYSLASAERLDSFSKELIDTLNLNLTENAGKFVCIIAGYGEQIDKCILAHNQGLRSRFRFRFNIDTYTSAELRQIFELKLHTDIWAYHPEISAVAVEQFFKNAHANFKYFGRDMETLLFHTKVVHANRVFFESKESHGKITLIDLKLGYQKFLIHTGTREHQAELPIGTRMMYI